MHVRGAPRTHVRGHEQTSSPWRAPRAAEDMRKPSPPDHPRAAPPAGRRRGGALPAVTLNSLRAPSTPCSSGTNVSGASSGTATGPRPQGALFGEDLEARLDAYRVRPTSRARARAPQGAPASLSAVLGS